MHYKQPDRIKIREFSNFDSKKQSQIANNGMAAKGIRTD